MHAMRRHRYFAAGAAFYSLTALSTAFAALKAAGMCEAAMATASPVCGFRPVRAARSLVVNFPKPATATVSPRATAAAMTENMAAAAAEVVVRGKTMHENPLGACPWSFCPAIEHWESCRDMTLDEAIDVGDAVRSVNRPMA